MDRTIEILNKQYGRTVTQDALIHSFTLIVCYA